jgi:hypothetical protein
LSKELNLKDAVSCVFKDYFMVFVNNNVYILDGKQKYNDSKLGTYVYESYFWNNVPATEVMCYEESIYFAGIVDGDNCICKFYTVESAGSYNDNGDPIIATWSTPYDNDNGTQYFKTMQKKGSLVTLKPYMTSSASIYFAADGDSRELMGTVTSTLQGFGYIDFASFSFESTVSPQDKFFTKKKKKYKRLQIIIENGVLGEGLGVIEIVKSWYDTRYAK